MSGRPETIFCCTLALLILLVGRADAQDHVLRSYGAAEGIGAAADLVLDREGRLVVATSDGVSRRVGTRAEPLSMPVAGSAELLAAGPRGGLWAVTDGKLVSLESGWHVPLPDSVQRLLTDGAWYVRLRVDASGTVWMNGRRGALYAFSPRTRVWHRHLINTDGFTAVSFFFRADTLVVAERWRDEGRVRTLIRQGETWQRAGGPTLTTDAVQEVHPRGRSGVWIIAREGVFLATAGLPRRVSAEGQQPWWFSEGSVDRRGRLLVGFGDGVRRYDAEGRLETFIRRAEFSGGLPLKQVTDEEGGIWIAHTQGLAHLEHDYLLVYPISGGTESIVKDLVRGPRDEIWAAAWDGIYRASPTGFERVERADRDATPPASRPLLTPGGSLVWAEGDALFQATNRGVTRLPAGRDVPLAATPQGTLTVNAQGTWWKRADGSRRKLSDDAGFERAAVTSGDVVWLTQEGQLDVVVQGLSGRHHPEVLSPSHRRVLAATEAAEIGEIHRDPTGRIWLAAFGAGKGLWCLFQQPDGAWDWRHWEGPEDGFLADVSSLSPTNDGRLWIGTWRGLQEARIAADSVGGPALQLLRQFRGRDGLSGEQVEAVLEDSEGYVWFAAAAGRVFRLDPRRVPRLASPPVLFSRMTVDDQIVRRSPEPIRVAYQQARLSIDLAPRTYRQLHEVRYAYRLVPYDTTWAFLGEGGSLRIPVLPVGEHTLEVRATRAGVAPGPVTRQAFVVSPPFYRRWWFGFLVTLAAMAPLLIWYRVRLLRQLAAERLRLRIATDLHDDLGGGLTQVSLYGELIRRESEAPAAAWAGEVVETARVLTETMRDIVWSFSPADETVDALAARMRAAAAGLCEATGLALDFDVSGDRHLVLSSDIRRNVLLMFKELVHNTVKHARATRLQVSLHAGRGVLHLHVHDDGQGFTDTSRGGGHGLRNLERRRAELGATLQMASAPQTGTTVDLHVPLSGGKPARASRQLPIGWGRGARTGA